MDRQTVQVYDQGAGRYARQRSAEDPTRAAAFATAVPEGRPRVDLGCGPGLYTGSLGRPVVALDAAGAMLAGVTERAPGAWRLQGDLEALPFRGRSLAGAWASKCYHHLAPERLPLALADLHRSLEVGAPFSLACFRGDGFRVTGADDDFPGRLFANWTPARLVDVVTGAGFDVDAVEEAAPDRLWLSSRRARTLADTVGPGMRLLVCGLNPSLYAADVGVAYARPGNRFWAAARAAGLVRVDRDPRHALRAHGVGMTDLVKRATVGAAELGGDEYRAGLARVERLCVWLRPGVVCLVGLSGWRVAAEPRAAAGPQPRPLGGCPVYVMPSTSGLNAHASLDDLTAHLRAAAALADGQV